MVRLNTMSSVRNVFIHASRAFGYQSCFAKSIKKPNSEGRIIRNGGTPFFFGNILPLVPLNVIVLYIISEQILKPSRWAS